MKVGWHRARVGGDREVMRMEEGNTIGLVV